MLYTFLNPFELSLSMTPHLICQILPNTSKLVQGRYTRKKMGNSRKGKNAKCLSEENRELLQFAKLNNFTFWHLCNEESQKKKLQFGCTSTTWVLFIYLWWLSCSISVTYINWLLGVGQKFQAPKPTDLGICSLLGTGSCRDKLRALHRKRRTQSAIICCTKKMGSISQKQEKTAEIQAQRP